MNILYVVLITFSAGVLGTFLGGLIGILFKNNSEQVIGLMLSYAAGIMISVVCFDLIETSMDYSGLYSTVVFIIVGFIIIYILDDSINKKMISNSKNPHSELFISGVITAIAISLHNIPEGMAIGASFSNVMNISFQGLSVAIVIGLHNIPEGLTITLPLTASDYKRTKALLISALSGFPTVLGAIIGYYISGISSNFMAVSLDIASGAMLYVVFGELIGQSEKLCKSKVKAFTGLIGLLTGLIILNIKI